jgi:regulator of protease activity HflC (stomatin/prohibitin superfamily)
MNAFFLATVATFFLSFILVPLFLGLVRMFGVYAVVHERTCRVYVLFGKVIGILDEPGLHLLWLKLGLRAPLVHWLGKCYVLDMRLDQEYLRSQAVNSEEGAPMGIGIWYEMYISDPVAFLFKNADPRGSLRANVSNATVRCLSNLNLDDMLTNRHAMSRTVRAEVSPKSHEWGYRLGSIYIRKVHFRDGAMIRQIEEKVVNRLRQVTSAILQGGANQVRVITSTAERQAAVEFAKAAALRPRIVGAALQDISNDPEVLAAMFHVLETQRVVDGKHRLTLIPGGTQGGLLPQLLVAQGGPSGPLPPDSTGGRRPRTGLPGTETHG